MTNFYCSFAFEIAIHASHRVGIDDEGFRKGPNARQLAAWRERSGFDGVTNLFLDLQIDRDAGRWIGLSKHCGAYVAQRHSIIKCEMWADTPSLKFNT